MRSSIPVRCRAFDRALIERGEVGAAPERALELLGLFARPLEREHLAEDVVPGHHRHAEEQQHDALHDPARIQDQSDDGEVLSNVHPCTFSRRVRRHRGGLERARIHARDPHASRDEQLVLAQHALVELEPHMAGARDRSGHGELVVEARGPVVVNDDPVNDEEDLLLGGEVRKLEAERAQELGARSLHEVEVNAVVHDPARVGVLVINADRP